MSRLLHLPPARGSYIVDEGLKVPMRDGIALIADRYIPTPGEVRGTVLVRSPYGRRPPYSNLYARIFAERGYQVVIQSARGTFGSGGSFNAIREEVADSQDTVSWLREQPWFTGTFATVGMSYLGWTQWTLLADPPPELVASVSVVGFHDAGRMFRGTGALSLEAAFSWADSVATQEDHGWFASLVVGTLTTKRRSAQGVGGLPLREAAERPLRGRSSFYFDWLTHEDTSDEFWKAHRVPINGGKVPVLVVGGWHDLFVDQTVEQYTTLRARGADVAMTIGPWTHIDALAKGSGVASREALRWLDRYLAGDSVAPRTSPVSVFVTGGESWEDFEAWPPATVDRQWFLQPGGALAQGTPSEPDSSTSFVYDPSNPTPSVGGRTLNPKGGSRDNRSRERRDDVITFTSEPLPSDLEVAGTPRVTLHRSADTAFSDVMVRVCEVDTKGRSFNVSDAYLRLRDDVGVLTLSLDPIHHLFRAGSRLRVQISGGSHPQYDRNLGTGEPAATGVEMRSSTHIIRHDSLAPSSLTLPAVERA